jgi:hypothetical protein
VTSGAWREHSATLFNARRDFAAASPIPGAASRTRIILARYGRNPLLSDACHLCVVAALSASPGARDDGHRALPRRHHQDLHAPADRLVGILHACLRYRILYDEPTAWAHRTELAA